jgi:hypothetical protein
MYVDGPEEVRETYAQSLINNHDLSYAEKYAFDNTKEN